jgi:hypothetical protein
VGCRSRSERALRGQRHGDEDGEADEGLKSVGTPSKEAAKISFGI